MKNYIKSVGALTVICCVIALLLAVTNAVTAPMIEENASAEANAALLVVMPDGEGFEPVDISAYELPATVNEVYKETNGGYVVKMTTSGYGSGMVIMCGVDGNGVVTGATCLESSETLGYEKTYGESTVGASADTIDTVDTVASATKTTLAYRNAVKDALNTAIILGGGSVDVRTEEEILADSLSEALPAGEGSFESVFITEKLDGITSVYKAENGSGYVFVFGDVFVGLDSEGKVVSETSEDIKTSAELQAQLVMGSEATELDISGYENMPTQVEKAYKTASGNYVFDLKAAGFGINGDHYYNPSGEHIKIKVSVSADREIISCVTTYQSESDGIGSACADAGFYTQFNGKTEENSSDIDAISGATITTNGYKVAVSKVFEAIKIIEGEA